jgi:hypothetical protein
MYCTHLMTVDDMVEINGKDALWWRCKTCPEPKTCV